MADTTEPIVNLFALHEGQAVEVHCAGQFRYRGFVEESMPRLDVVWVRDLKTGERKMLSLDEHRLYQV